MRNNKQKLLIISAIIVIGCLLYIPQMHGLGLYRDAWNYFYNLTVRGPEMLVKAFQADRPADGYLIAGLYKIFGTNINAYLIYCLCCRILSSVSIALTVSVIWEKSPKMAALAGILAAAFPGFLQQVDAITYIPHQTAMFCFMLSLWLTALSCDFRYKNLKVLLTIISALLSFINVMLMEYYVGMEIYRLGVIYLMNRGQAGKEKPQSFFRTLMVYLPYLLPVAGFVVWRGFFFHATRSGTDFMTEIITPFLTHPRHEIADLGVRILKNVWKLFAGSWTLPASGLINGLDMKDFLKAFIPSVIVLAVCILFLFLLHGKETDGSGSESDNSYLQWFWFGLIGGSVAILPLVVSGRDINFISSLDRFAWPGMFGAILFLFGLFGALQNRAVRNFLTISVLLLSFFVQWQNQTYYAGIWKNTLEYWQQLIWRVPSLQMGTTIVTAGSLLTEEDYEIFAPASMIYYPEVQDWAPVSAEVLSENTVRDIRLGEKIYRNVREIYTEKDYQQLFAISKPDAAACLHVINGESPVYSLRDYSKIPSIGSYSKLEQIILDPETPVDYPFFLTKEQDHDWCYYYEKMELALQQDDPQTAASLADEAFDKKLRAGDSVELIPVIEAYAQTGRVEDARLFADDLMKNDYMALMADEYFRTRLNDELYQELFVSAAE